MSSLVFEEYLLPAYWASALINGDESSMTDDEVSELTAWLKHEEPGYCVSCSIEPEFSLRCDADVLPGNCLIYTFQRN